MEGSVDFWVWVQTAGAVFAGNLLTAVFAYAFFVIWRDERTGGDGWHLPLKVYVCWSIPLLFGVAVLYSLR